MFSSADSCWWQASSPLVDVHFLLCSDTVSKCSRMQRKIVPFSTTSHAQSRSIIFKRRQTFQITPKWLWKTMDKKLYRGKHIFLGVNCAFRLVCKYCCDSSLTSLGFDALFYISSFTFSFLSVSFCCVLSTKSCKQTHTQKL